METDHTLAMRVARQVRAAYTKTAVLASAILPLRSEVDSRQPQSKRLLLAIDQY